MKCTKCGHDVIRTYEFRFVPDHGMQPTEIKTFRGLTAKDALRPYQSAIGNFWSITGYRREGSIRFKPCSIRAWRACWS